MPKMPFPKNAAGLSDAELGRLAGLSQKDKAWRAFTKQDIANGVQRLKDAGVSKVDIRNASDFYQYNAFRDIGNEAAAFRSYYLEQIFMAW